MKKHTTLFISKIDKQTLVDSEKELHVQALKQILKEYPGIKLKLVKWKIKHYNDSYISTEYFI